MSGFPAATRVSRLSMPWSSALRSRCSSGTDQLLEHRAVELDLRAADFEVGPLVEFLRRLPQNAVQTLRQAAEGHGPDREQLLLHVARQARLREQRSIGFVEVLEQRLLDGRNVVDAFGQAARQFLEPRVAIEFQRIEALGRLVDHRHARLDLRLGLDFDLAHLRAQANDAIGELEQIAFERAEFALDAGARYRNLPGLVHESIDQLGADAQHRPRGFAFGGRRFGRMRCGGRLGRARRDRQRRDDGAVGRLRLVLGRRLGGGGEPRRRRIGFTLLQAIEQKCDMVQVVVQRVEKCRRRRRRIAAAQAAFHRVRDLSESHRAGHARAALERMQRALQGLHHVARSRLCAPVAQLLAGLREKFGRLVEEYRQYLTVDVVMYFQQRGLGLRDRGHRGRGQRCWRGATRR